MGLAGPTGAIRPSYSHPDGTGRTRTTLPQPRRVVSPRLQSAKCDALRTEFAARVKHILAPTLDCDELR